MANRLGRGADGPRRILVIQLKRIGDLVLTTPVLAALRERFPDAEVTVAIDAAAAGLAAALPAGRVLVFQRRGMGFWRDVIGGGFDVALDFTGNDRSALVTALSRAAVRVTYQRFRKKPLRGWVYNAFVDSSVRHRHTADHHTDLLRALGLEVTDVPTQIELPTVAEDEAGAALRAAGIGGPFVVVHPGTTRAEKFWRAERWAEVITAIRGETGSPVVLTGSTDPAETAHIAEIQSRLAEPVPNLAGQLSLLGTAAVFARARLLLTVDSAPVHLADALGVPQVALFGPTNPFHWRPRRAGSAVLTPGSVSQFSPDARGGAMDGIVADAVVAAALGALRL